MEKLVRMNEKIHKKLKLKATNEDTSIKELVEKAVVSCYNLEIKESS